MKVNLNELIRVKLTDKGYLYYCAMMNKVVIEHNLPFQHHTMAELYDCTDAEGYITIRFWEFIDLFGGLGMGLDQFVAVVIETTGKFNMGSVNYRLSLIDNLSPVLSNATYMIHYRTLQPAPGKLFCLLQNIFN